MSTTTARPAIGFTGLGDQGLPMATAIAEAGYPFHVRAPTTLGLSWRDVKRRNAADQVGPRARFRCRHRPFPAAPLPHPACGSHRTGRSMCLTLTSAFMWLAVSGVHGVGMLLPR